MTTINTSRASMPQLGRPVMPVPAPADARALLRRLNLLDRLVDQREVVILGDVAVEQLGRDRERQIDRLAADVLDRPVLLELDLLLRALHDRLTVGDRLLPHLFVEGARVALRARDDRLGVYTRLVQDLRGFLADALEFLARLLRVLDRLRDH